MALQPAVMLRRHVMDKILLNTECCVLDTESPDRCTVATMLAATFLVMYRVYREHWKLQLPFIFCFSTGVYHSLVAYSLRCNPYTIFLLQESLCKPKLFHMYCSGTKRCRVLLMSTLLLLIAAITEWFVTVINFMGKLKQKNTSKWNGKAVP